ncbi:putative ABC exporter domain-containing protein, partial [bacterium]|nr:putative ABC exporter domain-containing protein [bacterium]
MFSNISPLFYLIHLKNKAWFRRIFYSFFSIKRAIFTIVAICMILLWLLPQLFIAGREGLQPVESIRLYMPMFFLLFFTMNLATIQKEAALYFEPNEIGFLFAGPFSRRDLLLYKMSDYLKKLFFSALIFSVIAHRWSPYWITSFVGFFMLFSFMVLLDIAVVLFMQSSWMDRRLIWGFVGLIGIAAAVFFMVDLESVRTILDSNESNPLTKYISAFHATWFGSILLAPFKVFAYLITARSLFPEWITYASIAVAINAGLIGIIFLLDKNYLEISLEI